MRKYLVTCPSCGRDFYSVCNDDTGFAIDPCDTCGQTADEYWSPDDGYGFEEDEEDEI